MYKKLSLVEKIVGSVLTILFLLGAFMAGSDGEWFPWGNLAGAVLAGAIGITASMADMGDD